MTNTPSEETRPDVSSGSDALEGISNILEGIMGAQDRDRLQRLRLALEVVRQQAQTLNAEITQKMERLGLELPTDKAES
jgi:hypothetical protein